MITKYPIILTHGIMMKEGKLFNSFGYIKAELEKQGFCVYTGNTDGLGTVENNAEQLKRRIEQVLSEQNAEKVNIIAHSKGGLDAKYMIENLGMENKVASLTTLCTPHKGSQIASKLLKLPKFILYFLAFWLNIFYKILKDEKPDAIGVCKQLSYDEEKEVELLKGNEIYCQSYSATVDKAKNAFVLFIPYLISRRSENDYSDGLVAKKSTKFGEYKGDALAESLNHNEIVCYLTKKKKKQKVASFYVALCSDLAKRGF